MSFIHNLFKTASAITDLERDLVFVEREKALAVGELAKERTKNVLLEKAVESARRSENLALRRIADGKFKQQGLPQKFVDDATPKVVVVEEPDEVEEARILELATQMRDADKLDPELDETYPIEWYIDEVKKTGIDSIILN